MAARKKILGFIEIGDFVNVERCMGQCDKKELNIQDKDGNTLLHRATQKLSQSGHTYTDSFTKVVLLLAQHVDGTIKNKRRELAVHVILKIDKKKYECVLNVLLAQEGVLDLCCKDKDLLMPVLTWLRWDNVTSEDMLCFLRSVVNMRDVKGYTPLMNAAMKGNSQGVIDLVNNGADVKMVIDENSVRNSPNALRLALGERCSQSSDYLIPDPIVIKLTSEAYTALIHPSLINESKLCFGETPLHLAARTGNSVAVEALVKAGANPAIDNAVWVTPLQAALSHEHVTNASTILQLIPQDPIYCDTIVTYLWALQQRRRLPETADVSNVLARLFLNATREEFFTSYDLTSIVLVNNEAKIELGNDVYPSLLSVSQLYVLCFLVRKGLGAKTSIHFSAAVSQFRAFAQMHGQHDALSEDTAEKAHDIDALFKEPLSLFEQCRFTVRDYIKTPKHEKIRQLPVPKAIQDKLMFLDLGKEIKEMINVKEEDCED